MSEDYRTASDDVTDVYFTDIDTSGSSDAPSYSIINELRDRASRLGSQASVYVKGLFRWNVVDHSDLPGWLRDNEWLREGHRPQLYSFKACFHSLFRFHTETVNIWSHLLGSLTFVFIAAYFWTRPAEEVRLKEKLIFGIFFAGAIICMAMSALFHTVCCHSPSVSLIFNKLDYCGISILTISSFIPWIHYAFKCNVVAQYFYISFITALGIACICLSMMSQFTAPGYRVIRAAVFVAMGLSAIIPAVHFTCERGFWSATSLGWLVVVGLFYISGAVLYAARIPERIRPGQFDLYFSSHQVMHVFVVIAAFTTYHSITMCANEVLLLTHC